MYTKEFDLLTHHGVQISMAEVGEPTPNGYAERLTRTIKEEEVDLSDYQDYHDAYGQIGRFLEDMYMRHHLHSSLHYRTPAEFEHQCPFSVQFYGVTSGGTYIVFAGYVFQKGERYYGLGD